MNFKINTKYTFIFIIVFLILGFYIDFTFFAYAWYGFFFFGIAGILLLIIWFQIIKKYKIKKVLEVIFVLFYGIGYIFFITIIQSIELKKHGIKTNGMVQRFEKSRRDRNYGTFIIEFVDKKNKKYESKLTGNILIHQKGDIIPIIYSNRVPEINHPE